MISLGVVGAVLTCELLCLYRKSGSAWPNLLPRNLLVTVVEGGSWREVYRAVITAVKIRR